MRALQIFTVLYASSLLSGCVSLKTYYKGREESFKAGTLAGKYEAYGEMLNVMERARKDKDKSE